MFRVIKQEIESMHQDIGTIKNDTEPQKKDQIEFIDMKMMLNKNSILI